MPIHKDDGLNKGVPDHVGQSDEIKELAQARIDKDYGPHVLGNLADVQRAGAPDQPDSVGAVAKENLPQGVSETKSKKK